MSELEQAHQEHSKDGIIALSVLIRGEDGGLPDVEDAIEWREVLGLTLETLVDEDGQFTEIWNPDQQVPLGYVLDQQGQIILTERAGVSGVDEMVEAALALL